MVHPLVTVYITNYNYGNYIEQAINSVLSQSYSSIELLIIDDGSTDNSKSIIEKYENRKNIELIYQRNKGLNITNNIALRIAKGKYIVRLDADDYFHTMAIEKMVMALEQDSDLGLVFPDYFHVDKDNHQMNEVKRHNFDRDVNLFDQPAHGACTMIRVNFLRAVGGYDESYTCQDGYELWIKFISRYKISNIREPLFYYRQHGENLTSNENRILSTRRQINQDFTLNNNISTPKTLGIIPIRPINIFSKESISEYTKWIDFRIQKILSSKLLDKVIFTSSDLNLERHITEHYNHNPRLAFITRTKLLERHNISLNQTVQNVIDHCRDKVYHAIMVMPFEYIFLEGAIIDDAIRTLSIFGSDSLISVRAEHSTFYQHHGEGMTPIMNQDQFTRLEREALYKSVGGVILTTLKSFTKNNKLISGKVGHITVDRRTAFAVNSLFDLKLASLMIQENLNQITQIV